MNTSMKLWNSEMNTKTCYFLLISLLLLIMQPAEAAKTTKAAPKTKVSTAKPVDKEQEARKLKLANEMFQLSGTKSELKQSAKKLISSQLKSPRFKTISKIAAGKNPAMQAKLQKITTEVFEKDIDLAGEMTKVFAREYANEFSEKELKELISYYKSPTAQKGLKLGPQFTEEINRLKKSIVAPKVDNALQAAIKEETGAKK